MVMTDVKTGKVLAWVSYVDEGRPATWPPRPPRRRPACSRSSPAARCSRRASRPSTRQCYSGGEHSIKAKDLIDDKKRDKYCATLSAAMGRSLNTVFARLAQKNLDKDNLESHREAARLGRDDAVRRPDRHERPQLPDDERARLRAHRRGLLEHDAVARSRGSNLATTVANGGEMIRLSMVDKRERRRGRPVPLGRGSGTCCGRALEERTVAARVTSDDGGDRQTTERATRRSTIATGRSYLPDVSRGRQDGHP
jgi:peptidoglycan glycosyltransferase